MPNFFLSILSFLRSLASPPSTQYPTYSHYNSYPRKSRDKRPIYAPAMTINPALRPPRGASRYPTSAIFWDVQYPPTTASLTLPPFQFSPRRGNTTRVPLNQYATNPPSRNLTLRLRIPNGPKSHVSFGWPISAYAPGGLTVADVLGTIYRAVNTAITHEEWEKTNKKMQWSVSRAFNERWMHSRDPRAVRARGVIRLDYLGGRTRFAGMTVRWARLATGGEGWLCEVTLDTGS